MARTQASDPKPLLLFGFAGGAHGKVVYKLRGQIVGKEYHISLELTNHTDEGTYASAFTLQSLYDFYERELDQVPNEANDIIEWVEFAFGPKGTAARRGKAPSWEPAAAGGPRLTAEYQADPDQNPVVLSLPPSKFKTESEGFPLRGNLPPKQASEVRCSITDAAVKKTLATEAKLAECERQRLALAAAAQAVRDLQPDNDKGVKDVIKMLRGLSGTTESALESEHEEAAAAGVEVEADGAESQGQGASQWGLPAKRPREAGSQPAAAGPAPGGRRAALARGRRRNQRLEVNPLAITSPEGGHK